MKQQQLFIILAVILLCLVTAWLYFSSDDTHTIRQLDTSKVDFSLANNDKMNEVQSASQNPVIENFALTDAQKASISTLVSGITDSADKFEAANLLSNICTARPPNKFTGYRALQSGATFKFELIPTIASTYILHGINNRVVSVNSVTKSLTMAVKNTADVSQQFILYSITRENIIDGSSLPTTQTYYYFVPKVSTLSSYALQYEHEQLSIRPIIKTTSGTPTTSVYKGQVFVFYSAASDAELEANALDVGQAVGIDPEDLQPGINQIYKDFIPATTSASGGASPPSAGSSNLSALTNAQVQSVIDSLLPSLKTYFTTPNPSESNPFANKGTGELTINVNLDDKAANEAFQDLSGPTNIAQSSTRALLESYLKQQKLEMGGIPALGEQLTQSANGNVAELLGRLKSCPTFDRSKYVTERQISQCSGCTPDPYLKGML
jgi:hypothetical protein